MMSEVEELFPFHHSSLLLLFLCFWFFKIGINQIFIFGFI